MSYGINKLKELIGNGMLDLSLEEKKVGTDISGKPIYSRTFTGTSNMTLIDTGNIERIILQFGDVEYGDEYIRPLWYCDSTTWSGARINSSKNLEYRTTHDGKFTLTCLYTKTTD